MCIIIGKTDLKKISLEQVQFPSFVVVLWIFIEYQFL